MSEKTLTFYSGKLWHSDKPFPKACSYESKISCGSAECLNEGCGFIREWLSTAYEVVNPELITGGFHKSVDEWNRAFQDGDQITLPEGYGIETAARHKWKEGTGMEFVRFVATITLPNKTLTLNSVFKDIPKGKFDQHYKGEPREVSEPSESQEDLFREMLDELYQLESQTKLAVLDLPKRWILTRRK